MRHGGCLSAEGSAAPTAAFTAIKGPGMERGRTRRPQQRGGWRAPRILLALQSRPLGGGGGKSSAAVIASPVRLRQIGAREGRGAASFSEAKAPARPAAAAPYSGARPGSDSRQLQ